MNLRRIDFRTERRWRSGTGMTERQFDILLSHFMVGYVHIQGSNMATRHLDNPQDFVFSSEEDLLLFTLFSLKSELTYDLLGITCGMDGGSAQRNFVLGLTILQSTLYDLGMMPVRDFTDVATFRKHFAGVPILLLDVTEQRIQRPSDDETQKDNYSGKKSPYSKNTRYL